MLPTRNINPTKRYLSEWVDLGNGIIAHRYGICSTTLVGYDVYEPLQHFHEAPYYSHSTMTHHPVYGALGSLDTRALTPELDALKPYSDERIEKVTAYLDDLKRQSAAYIRQAFPQDFV